MSAPFPRIPLVMLTLIVLALVSCGEAGDGAQEPVEYEASFLIHHQTRSNELDSTPFVGEAGLDDLADRATGIDARDETPDAPDAVAAMVRSDDPLDGFYVTFGYYCGSGDPVAEASAGLVAVTATGLSECEEPNPVTTGFRIPWEVTGDTFTLELTNENGPGVRVFEVVDRQLS